MIAALRDICLTAGLSEHAKWGSPCYMHAGRNIALIRALKDEVRLSFFNAALLVDVAGMLEFNGPNTAHPGIVKFRAIADVTNRSDVLRAYLAEAMGHAEAGRLPPKSSHMPDMPDKLIEALDADPELAKAFHALTPGRKKSYLINLNGAKQSNTRITRIAKFRPKILAGKGALDR